MGTIQFTTVIGGDGVIHPPLGVDLPKGESEVTVRPNSGPPKPRPGPGICKGLITYMAPDFDAALDEMKDYA